MGRHAIRSLLRRPHGLIAAALSIVVGVGLNTTVVGLLADAFARPLPYSSPDGLVTVIASANASTPRSFLTEAEATALRSFEDIFHESATIERWPASRRAWMDSYDGTAPFRVAGALVTPNLFRMLGVVPVGRDFDERDASSANRVAIITAPFAHERYGDTEAVGKELRINGSWYAIVGVLPPSFVAPVEVLPPPYDQLHRIDIWILQDPEQLHGGPGKGLKYSMVARQTPHSEGGNRRAEINRRMQGPVSNYRPDYAAVPLRTAMLADSLPGFRIIALLGTLLLLIAISSVITVSLMRVDEQKREVAIRVALGASGWRVWGATLTEGALLCVGMGLVGATAGALGAAWFRNALPQVPWHASAAGHDWYAATVAAGVTAAAALGGLAISLRAYQPQALMLTLANEGDRAASRLSRLQRGIVVCQVFLMVALLAPTVALWQAFARVEDAHQFLSRRDVIVAETWLLSRLTSAAGGALVVQERLLERIRQLPGVADVGMGSETPLLGTSSPTWITRADGEVGHGPDVPAFGQAVDASYLSILGLVARSGRLFTTGDSSKAAPVAIVSESLAQLLFSRGDVVGRFLDYHGRREIVGVVRDLLGANATPRPTLYVPRLQEPLVKITVLVRAQNAAVTPAVLRRLAGIDPEQPIDRLLPLSDVVSTALSRQRIYRSVATMFGAGAILLGLSGIHLVTRYWINKRRHEIGIRLALGAARADIVGTVVMSQFKHVSAGIAIAVPATVLVVQWLAAGVSPLALSTSSAVIQTVVAIALLTVVGTAVLAWTTADAEPVSFFAQNHRAALIDMRYRE